MISLNNLDIFVIVLFLLAVLVIGLIPKSTKDKEQFLLSGRNMGLFLFVVTNVATWYGGILGIGELSYNYGLLSWLTQGVPYYIFAIIFALTIAKKIRETELITIPDKIEKDYGKNNSILAAIVIFVLVSPAPYLLMLANIISMLFNINIFLSLIIAAILSSVYLFKGGYKSDLYTDTFEFFIMFIGFGILFFVAYTSVGDFTYLKANLPAGHLRPFSQVSISYIVVWFLIALWTFADPGFHQRCYAAKNAKVASRGILISVILWILFDFLTNVSGLYSKAVLPNLGSPVMAFPLLAEKILSPGLKGLFYAALFATILSTLNSFVFLSATTFSNDLVTRLNSKYKNDITKYTRIGLFISLIISILLAYYIKSVIDLWYTIGSICIPSLILVILSSYYPKIKIAPKFITIEIIVSLIAGLVWYIIRPIYIQYYIFELVEPMIVGLFAAVVVHGWGLINKYKYRSVNV
ncbi:MAG: sodium:solute symporter family protein [bacterium]